MTCYLIVVGVCYSLQAQEIGKTVPCSLFPVPFLDDEITANSCVFRAKASAYFVKGIVECLQQWHFIFEHIHKFTPNNFNNAT
ncbi:hypothetical protein FACHB389_03770 [Nostoc calcicola FACHB-389]|nr:hypothetical protein FACHB389_03770 [Nostoc calcicola FACHB-389]